MYRCRGELLEINDNNFQFSVARHFETKLPDDDEFILIRLPVGFDGDAE